MTGSIRPGVRPPPRFDVANTAVGSAMTAALVALLGFGVVAATNAVTGPYGINIGGAIVAMGGSLVGVALGRSIRPGARGGAVASRSARGRSPE